MTDHLPRPHADDRPDTRAANTQDMPLPGPASKSASRRASLVRVISESAAIFDVIAIAIAALLTAALYTGLVIQAPIDVQRVLGLSAVAGMATVGVFAYLQLYRSENVLRPRYAVLQKIVAGWLLVIIGLIVVAFLTKTSEDFSRGWAILWAITAPAVILAGRFAIRQIATRIMDQGRLSRYVAIVGAGPVADRLALHLRNRSP
ncbi:MAG: hypothetical protein AAFY01_03415, partial [Pseudomonadota bacterium]